jgi:hypothetical protein
MPGNGIGRDGLVCEDICAKGMEGKASSKDRKMLMVVQSPITLLQLGWLTTLSLESY